MGEPGSYMNQLMSDDQPPRLSLKRRSADPVTIEPTKKSNTIIVVEELLPGELGGDLTVSI